LSKKNVIVDAFVSGASPTCDYYRATKGDESRAGQFAVRKGQ